MESKEYLKQIAVSGTPAEKLELFNFTLEETNEQILKRFKFFARSCYPHYFQNTSAPFHDEMVLGYINSYRGVQNNIEIAFRGAAKTSYLKLFITFVLLNDKDAYRKYIKVLAKDLRNAKQLVTDVYNNLVAVKYLYGDVFEKEGDTKREETMGSFTMVTKVKLTAGTVGQTQRGHLQDAYRPDWLCFEDIEDRESVSSIVITEGIIQRADEAIQGLSFGGSYTVNANYISDAGSVQWFLNKKDMKKHLVPIVTPNGVPTWERYTPEILAKLEADSEDWAGEYLVDPTRTGNKFFDVEKVRAMLSEVQPPTHTSGFIRYWDNYNSSHRYGIGEDLSDGIGKDSCALVLFDFKTGTQIASADDNETAPDLFTYDAVRLGREFGNCIIAPETNDTCGGIATRVLKEENYPNIYQKELTDKINNVVSTVIGWHTNSKSKPDMFYEFKKDFNDGLIIIKDERILREMLAFTKLDLRDARNSAITRHFDLLTATTIAYQMKDHAGQAEGVKNFYANLSGKKSGARG